MEPLTVDIPHKLGKAEAKRRIEGGSGRLTRFLPAGTTAEQSWTGDQLDVQFGALGQQVAAKVTIEEAIVRVSMVLPPALSFVRPMIEAGIRKGGTELLENKRS